MLSQKSVCLVWILGCIAFLGCGQQAAGPPNPIEEAKMLLFQGKYEEAITTCDSLIRIDGNNFEAYLVRGQVHEKMSDLEKALADYSSAIEAAPRHPDPHDYRYQLYMKLAKQVEDGEEKFRLQTLAAEDRRRVADLDPDASVAFKNDMRPPNPLLEQPIPKTPDEYTNKKVVEDELLAKDKEEKKKPVDNDPNEEEGEDANVAGGVISGEKEKDTINETAAEYASRVAKEAEDIRMKDLGDLESELTLPPHLDPETATLPPLPERPVTRFSLPTDIDGRLLLPQPSRQVSTGITAPTEPEDGNTDGNGESTGPSSRFYLQNQALGGPGLSPYAPGRPNQQGVRTGIGSSRPTSGGGIGPNVAGLQIGFMPPEARTSFGPRILFNPEDQQTPNQSARRSALPRKELAEGTSILTTALPGSTRIQGGNGRIPNTGNANLGQVQPGGMLQNGMTRSITDPSYTPFGARPKLPTATKSFPVKRSSGTITNN